MNGRFSLLVILVIISMAAELEVQSCQAFSYNFTLYGDAALGWGSSPDMITSPGPTMVLKQDDVLNLTLISHDGAPHQFFVDYNNDSILQPIEPQSSVFTNSSDFQFTADLNGTFVYRCSIHPATMYGTIIVNEIPIPEFQTLILPFFIVATLLAVIVFRRKHNVGTV
jgi:hypothetical protein